LNYEFAIDHAAGIMTEALPFEVRSQVLFSFVGRRHMTVILKEPAAPAADAVRRASDAAAV
jgi:hypothetical protein